MSPDLLSRSWTLLRRHPFLLWLGLGMSLSSLFGTGWRLWGAQFFTLDFAQLTNIQTIESLLFSSEIVKMQQLLLRGLLLAFGQFVLVWLLALLAEYGWADRVVVQSFDHRSLRTIRKVDDEIRLAALTTGGEAKVKVYNGYGFNIWSPRARDLTPELLAEAQGLGLRVIPWTVNDVDEMERLIEMGVDGLISDRPDLLLQR